MIRTATMVVMAAIGALALTAPALAQERDPALQALDDALPGTLINDPLTIDWNTYGEGVSTKRVKAKEIPGQYALRFRMRTKPKDRWEVATQIPVTGEIASGDTIKVALWARSVKAKTPDGLAVITPRLQRNAEPYDGLDGPTFTLTEDWTLYEFDGPSPADLAPGEAVLALQLGGAVQTLEVGQVYVMNLGERDQAAAAPPPSPKTLVPVPEGTALDPYRPALDALRAQLPNPGTLMNDPAATRWSAQGDHERAGFVASDHTPSGQAFEVAVRGRSANYWDVEALMPMNGAIREGDALLLAYDVRAVEADNEAQSGLVSSGQIHKASPPWDIIVESSAPIGPDWMTVYGADVADQDYAPGETNVTIQIAGARQTLQFGNAYVLNLGSGIDLSALPALRVDYEGRAPDAAWRAEAADLIETHRKANITVQAVGPDGAPAAGVPVRVRMTEHAFDFGTFVGHDLMGEGADKARTREVFAESFNYATAPAYWQDWGWQDAGMRENYLETMAALDEQGRDWRGHVLIYPAESHVPAPLKALADDEAAFAAWVSDHVRTVANVAAPFGPSAFDVINEPRDGAYTIDRIGMAGVAEAFEIAGQAMPDTTLYVNDYGILSGGGRNDANIAYYHDFVERLLDTGAPLGGIGLQGHFGAQLTDPARIGELLDEFSRHGLPLQITEFDVDTPDEETQADYTRDVMTVAFSRPAVDAFVVWGFWEGDHWRPNGAMLREDWSEKPNYGVWRDLIFSKWWTDETVTTDEDGTASLRGFKGAYCASAADGEEACFDASGEAGSVTVTVP